MAARGRPSFALRRFQIAFNFWYEHPALITGGDGWMQGKITKTSVDRLEPWTVLWDSEVKGFGVRRHGADARHYLLRYRFGGKQTFRKIGRHGSPFTPDTARTEARRLLGLVASGVNPAAKPPQSEDFGSEVERYLTHKQGLHGPTSRPCRRDRPRSPR
jgi:Arm DNA-binding domain